jgi:hypothetical protein
MLDVSIPQINGLKAHKLPVGRPGVTTQVSV